jgi:transposase
METQASPRPQPARPPLGPGRKPKKLKPIDRSQGLLVPLVIENLVPPDHKVRAIWALTGRLDLSRFLDRIVTTEGEVGRMAWNPRLLISIWIYAYSEQVSSAR